MEKWRPVSPSKRNFIRMSWSQSPDATAHCDMAPLEYVNKTMSLFHDLVVLFHTFLEKLSDWNYKIWHIMAKTAGSPCLCHLKHLLSTISGAQQALTHSLFLTTNKTLWRIWEAQIVSSFVSSCFNHLNGSHRRSHIAPSCSIIYIYIYIQSIQYYVCLLCVYVKNTYTARSYKYSGGSHRTSPLSKSAALLAFAPGLHRRSLLVPKRSTLLLRCTGAKVGRLEGWKAKLYMTPLKRSIFRPKFRIRLSQVAESNKSWSKTSSFFSLILTNGMQNWKLPLGRVKLDTLASQQEFPHLQHSICVTRRPAPRMVLSRSAHENLKWCSNR